ncbi:MAG TPA: four-carbon acid sugar kinase family protein [Cyclobacteriaceae bacterium]|nr:four-carbon acid sugar kinase family protein [Cyclobacteriaceae bacterium]
MSDTILSQLPAEYNGELLPSIREEFLKSEKTIVALDDDPTGTQTCYDVTVLSSWTVPLLVAELKLKPSILFILTNSRSLPEKDAVQLALEVGGNLLAASEETGRAIVPISRSDSTLRGHFPAEVNALADAVNMRGAIRILFPAFIEGGRLTIGDVHYIMEQRTLIPVAETSFAQDASFGYRHSDLREWVEEKTKGKTKASEVTSISLEDVRIGGPERVYEKLLKCKAGETVIVNACSKKDIEVFVMGLLTAERKGQKFLCRTSATFVPIRAGLVSGKILVPQKEKVSNGALVVVGSYVPKTTSQLEHLLNKKSHQPIEVNVTELLQPGDHLSYLSSIVQQANKWLSDGKDVVIYTSRRLETGSDADESLVINRLISDFLVSIVKGLTVRPAFIVAKGGITSSDIASKGLASQRALILGQIIPGVPVWKLEEKSKFPGITYVVFPGNVGDATALAEVCEKFKPGPVNVQEGI